MPEAAIDENRDTLAAKNDVGFAPQGWQRRPVEPVAEAQRVQRAAQGYFRPGTFPSLHAHPDAHSLGGGEGLAPTLRHRQ